MGKRTLGPWTLEIDPEATRLAYASAEDITPADGCGCLYCRNYTAALGRILTPAVRRFFETLGVDCRKAAQVSHITKLDSGLHLYSAYYPVIGQIESGETVIDDVVCCDAIPLDDHVQYAFVSNVLVNWDASFEGYPLFQLDMSFELPWVLDEPYDGD